MPGQADLSTTKLSGGPSIGITLVNIITLYFLSLHQRTSLHIAAGKGHRKAVESLVKMKADISTKDNDGVGICRLREFCLNSIYACDSPV